MKERVLHPIPISFGQFPDGLLQRKITALLRTHFPAGSFQKEVPLEDRFTESFQLKLMHLANSENRAKVSIYVEGRNLALPKKAKSSVHWADLFASGQSEVSLLPIVAALSPLMATRAPELSLALSWNSRIDHFTKRKLLPLLDQAAGYTQCTQWLRPETTRVLQTYLHLLHKDQGPQVTAITLASDGLRDGFAIAMQGRGYQELHHSTRQMMDKSGGGWSLGLHATSDKNGTLQAVFQDPGLAIRKAQSLIIVSGLPYLEIAGKSLKEAV